MVIVRAGRCAYAASVNYYIRNSRGVRRVSKFFRRDSERRGGVDLIAGETVGRQGGENTVARMPLMCMTSN